jgi:hypothetical protein
MFGTTGKFEEQIGTRSEQLIKPEPKQKPKPE